MKTAQALNPRAKQHGNRGPGLELAKLMLLALTAACGPALEENFSTRQEALAVDGLTTNGLSTEGLSHNGLTTNGLASNGLTNGALLATSFSTWFNSNAADYSNMVMRYVVKCAVASSATRTWTNPATGVTYTWSGSLGLTPSWAAGQPINLREQHLITACLAAHVNKFGRSVVISVTGMGADDASIPYDMTELATWSAREGAFFGNLFNGAGVFACSDRTLNAQESTVRACALSSQNPGASTECPPITIVGNCNSVCTKSDSVHWSSCSHGGITYEPITTRLKPADIYQCGDGVCQFTESCGNSNRYDSCQADCGGC